MAIGTTRRRWLLPVIVGSLLMTSVGPVAGPVIAADGTTPPDAPTGLSVNDKDRPLEVEGTPKFGWFPQDADGNEIQTAYQLEVRRASDDGVIWDSGKVASSEQAYVPYAGPALTHDASYTWRVRTWDRTDLESPWSATSGFDVGISDSEWNGAAWIRRTTTGNDSSEDWTFARKQFAVPGASPVTRARAYVAAMAQYELHVNGQTLYRGDSYTYPGEGYYQSTDITSLVAAGQPVAVGVLYHYWTCTCQGRANGPAAPNGPSGLLVRVVVDHADGSRETFVSDGTWRLTKATQYTNATLTTRNGDAGDRVERYDARNEIVGWDTVGFVDTAAPWANATVIGTHPRPTGFTHLNGGEHRQSYEVIQPVSTQTLSDGTVVADFGKVIPAMPSIHFSAGVSGRALTMTTSFRLAQTTLAAVATAGATNIKVAAVTNFSAGVGAKIEIDSGTVKEVRTIVTVGTAGAAGTGITLNAPLTATHATGRTVWGPKVGTAQADTQGSTLTWFYTQKAGAQTAKTFMYWGWRYLQINPPGPGEVLSPTDITAVVQHSVVRPERTATFTSDNATLNQVYELMIRSGIYSSTETFVDTPTREKGQFTGDTVDISLSNMLAYGERDATQRAIREFLYSQIRFWNSGANAGRVNAVYPNGDGGRDIPDYTEFVPGWIMRYYLMTGDKSLVADSYQTMKNISQYIHNAQPVTGNAAGLVYNLPGGSGEYTNGIIDWPSPMRYGYPATGNGARTIHNAEAVDAYRSTAAAANLLGNAGDATLYGGWTSDLINTINTKLIIPSGPNAGLYTDGLSTAAGNPQLASVHQHALTYPIVYDIAPAANRPAMVNRIVSLGMNQGPMTWHILLDALAKSDRPDQIINLMTNPTADGPAKILANDGTFMWEQWNPTGAESHSHGWGSWGSLDVLETLLGTAVTGPGGSAVRIAPPRIGLQNASGSVWTQRGTVASSWSRGTFGVTLDVTVPVNVAATVALPAPNGEIFIASGTGAPQYVGLLNGRQVYTLGSGTGHFVPAEAPVVTNDAPAGTATVQYSDALSPDVTVSASDTDSEGSALTGVAVGLPAGLALTDASVSGPGVLPGSRTWTIDGEVTDAPGSYPVTVTVTDERGLVGSTSFTIVVSQEDADATYTGDQLTFTEPGGSSADVLLRATIRDSSLFDAGDTAPGDIRNATITFKEGATTLCGPLPVVLLGPDTTIGTASCTAALGVGSHVIDLIVDDYYTGTGQGLVEVAEPDGSFVTGGGHRAIESSAGTYAAAEGSRLQFSFNVKYTHGLKNLKGHSNTIFVSDGRTYQLKSNAIQSMGIVLQDADGNPCEGPPSDTCFGLVSFRSKANLTDITDPDAPVSIAGNLSLQITLTDKGSPGSNDSIGITVYSGDTLLFAADWDGAQTVEGTLDGGNLVVH